MPTVGVIPNNGAWGYTTQTPESFNTTTLAPESVTVSAGIGEVTSVADVALELDCEHNFRSTFVVTFGAGNIPSLTIANLDDGDSCQVSFIQDSVGGRTVVAYVDALFAGGGIIPTFSTDPLAIDSLVFFRDAAGNLIGGVWGVNFA